MHLVPHPFVAPELRAADSSLGAILDLSQKTFFRLEWRVTGRVTDHICGLAMLKNAWDSHPTQWRGGKASCGVQDLEGIIAVLGLQFSVLIENGRVQKLVWPPEGSVDL